MRIILLLSVLLSVSITCKLSTAGTIPKDHVLDVDGHKLLPNVKYYILPFIRGRGGGLTLARRNGTCPFNVAQEKLEVSNGLPLTFLPVNTGDKVIRLSTDMNIVFSAATICVQSTVWRLGSVDTAAGQQYIVTTGGVIGNPGRSTIDNWFKIEKSGDDYKLVFCPTVCNFCKVICRDVGIFIEGGNRWLGLSDVPFPVMFKRV